LKSPSLVAVCDEVRDPGNAGTIIRCADAFGASAVVLTAGSVEWTNPKVVRSSVGSVFHLPVVSDVLLGDALAWARGAGLQVVAADASGAPLRPGEPWLAAPTCWVFGNEAWGFDPADLASADRVVAIPMPGRAESLNVAAAAACCLFASSAAPIM
jgi:TrmH family RNA methyltransferase